MIAWIEE